MISGSKISKVENSLGAARSSEHGEFVVDMPQKEAVSNHKRCSGGHSDDGSNVTEDDAG